MNLFGIRPNGVILCRTEFIKGHSYVVMEAITEKQENHIDKSCIYYGDIVFKRKDGIIVQGRDIYLYGEVDFNNPEDISNIERFNLINDDNNLIYSNFNYDKGTYTTVDGKPKQYTTYNPLLWFKYKYCLLGKPARIVVYRCPKSMLK